ncbi:alcohol dehydrogenase [Obelidium mucronatum]|nr:alcohol dehydrogenase [Obelidium mucronatum]
MQAYILKQYGPAHESLALKGLPKPVAAKNQVLIRVKAAGLNAADWHFTKGDPYLIRMMVGLTAPRADLVPGTALAGVVEAVGPAAKDFAVGDEVFTEPGVDVLGAFGEYVAVPEGMVCLKPRNMSFEEAAAVPVSATTAYQAIHKFAKLQPGQTILINGASGGVGTAAVQIAKAVGAEVTTVCSTKNLALMKSLGADYTIDYTKENFTQSGKIYDYVLDTVASQSIADCCKVIHEKGAYVSAGGLGTGVVMGNVWDNIKAKMNPFTARRVEMAMNSASRQALEDVKKLIEEGKLKSVIDKVFTFDQIPEAMAMLEGGHVAGKVVVSFK